MGLARSCDDQVTQAVRSDCRQGGVIAIGRSGVKVSAASDDGWAKSIVGTLLHVGVVLHVRQFTLRGVQPVLSSSVARQDRWLASVNASESGRSGEHSQSGEDTDGDECRVEPDESGSGYEDCRYGRDTCRAADIAHRLDQARGETGVGC